MVVIRIFSIYKINRELKQWKKKYPQYQIEELEYPTKDCYVIYKYGTRNNVLQPIEAVKGAQKGFIEGFINKQFNSNRIFQPIEFEYEILKNGMNEFFVDDNSIDVNKELMEENKKLREELLEQMNKNQKLIIENSQLKTKSV